MASKKSKTSKEKTPANGSDPASVLQEIVAALGDYAPDPKKTDPKEYPREVVFAVGGDHFNDEQYHALSPEAKEWLSFGEKIIMREGNDCIVPPPNAMQQEKEAAAAAAAETEAEEAAEAAAEAADDGTDEAGDDTTEGEAEQEAASFDRRLPGLSVAFRLPPKTVKKGTAKKKAVPAGKKNGKAPVTDLEPAPAPVAKGKAAKSSPTPGKKKAAASEADLTAPLAFAKKVFAESGPVTTVREVTKKFKHLQRRDVLAIAAQLKINPATAATQYQRARAASE